VQLSFLRVFLLIISISCFSFFNTSAEEHSHSDTSAVAVHADGHKEEGKFDVATFIMHHIADAHDWHLFGHLSIPLPVILYTDNGLAVFMSSAFHHDDAGKTVVEKGGQRFVKFHEKIYYASETANEEGSFVSLDAEHHPTNLKPLDFSITRNVASMFMSMALLFWMFIGLANQYKRGNAVPKGFGSFLEPLVIFVRDDIAVPNIGAHKAAKFLPYLLTAFFFILINNLIGLVPIFPGGSNLTGNIAFTFVLATATMIITNINGNKDYWKHIIAPPVPIPLYIIMIPVEIIGIISKPFALMIRLFANITAGHVLIMGLVSLIFIFKSMAVAPISIAFMLFMNLIELMVAFLQAYIFTLLSALFIGLAVAEHEHEHH
jgi:F-type H+-transporting ATPase subunit a